MKKRYLILIIITVALLLCIFAGLAFAYFFTDIFKSNKTLFLKYISQNKDIMSFVNDEDIKAYSEKQKQTSYTSEGTIKTNVTFPDSSEAQMANILQNCNITFSGNVDNSSKYLFETIKANYSDTQSMKFYLYRNNDIYTGKIDEVLFKFVGIENNNLKEFATKMQLPENIISMIPDKIDLNNLTYSSNIFTDEEKSSLKEKYSKIIVDNLTDDMFSNEKSDEYTIYTLTISTEQLSNILVKALESLKEDELIIAKFKNYIINNYNVTEENVETYVTQYKETLQKAIDVYNSRNGSSTTSQNNVEDNSMDINFETQNIEDETNSSNNLIIKVYSNKQKLSKTEINLGNIVSFLISKSDDGAKIETFTKETPFVSAFIQKIKSPNETKFEFAFSKQNSQIFDLIVSYSGLDTDSAHESSEFTFDYDLGNSTITNAKTKFVVTYNVTKTFGAIQKHDIPNSELLLINTAPSMQNLETLYNNIATKTVQLNNTKLQALGLTEEQNPFMYYFPSIVPIGATYIMQNPDKSSYYAMPAFLGGISISLLVGENSILTRASNATILTDLSGTKEQISLDVNEVMVNYYSEKHSTNTTSSESLYSAIENLLKNFKTTNNNIEYSYNNGIITIRSKIDTTKVITGTLSETGVINWN